MILNQGSDVVDCESSQGVSDAPHNEGEVDNKIKSNIQSNINKQYLKENNISEINRNSTSSGTNTPSINKQQNMNSQLGPKDGSSNTLDDSIDTSNTNNNPPSYS